MKMMNGKPCMKCGGKIKYGKGGKYPKMQWAGISGMVQEAFNSVTTTTTNPNLYGINVPNIQFPSTQTTTTVVPVPAGLPNNMQNTGNPPGVNIWQPGWVNPTNPTEEKPAPFDNTSPIFTGKTGYNPFAQKVDPNQTDPQQKIDTEKYVLDDKKELPKCKPGFILNPKTNKCVRDLTIPASELLSITNTGLNAISKFVANRDFNNYVKGQIIRMNQRVPIPDWATNEQKQVPPYNPYVEKGGIINFKEGGTNMKQSITTQTTIPMGTKTYIPLSENELSALAHQFRGMGSDKSTYTMVPQGSGINNIGYLTPREQKQLSDYMNSRNAFQSIWEGLPNLLGASGAAALPESSRLKDATMRNSYFPGNTGYTDWLNYMQSQGYKRGGLTRYEINNNLKNKKMKRLLKAQKIGEITPEKLKAMLESTAPSSTSRSRGYSKDSFNDILSQWGKPWTNDIFGSSQNTPWSVVPGYRTNFSEISMLPGTKKQIDEDFSTLPFYSESNNLPQPSYPFIPKKVQKHLLPIFLVKLVE